MYTVTNLDEAKNIYIYGAGVIARKAIDILLCGTVLNITGVVVSEKNSKNINFLNAKEIKEIETIDDETVFIIATSEQYFDEIKATLEKNGYHNYVFWKDCENMIWKYAEYEFIDRRKNSDKVCFVLCGYKEFLWDEIFYRLERFIPNDIEVCLLSSGIHSEKLKEIADKNNWTYIFTKINDVTLIQNIGMYLFNQAEWIYKMDEDIFVTEDCFEHLMKSYIEFEKEKNYHIGFLGPIIPLNAYGHIYILNYFNMKEQYEKNSEKFFLEQYQSI